MATDYKALRAICRHDLSKQAFSELEVALADAKRYRWLRQLRRASNGAPFIARCFSGAFSQWTDENADEAIDAAMAVSETGEKHD